MIALSACLHDTAVYNNPVSPNLLPDTPRWLMANGREDEAVEVLAKSPGDPASNDAVWVDDVAR